GLLGPALWIMPLSRSTIGLASSVLSTPITPSAMMMLIFTPGSFSATAWARSTLVAGPRAAGPNAGITFTAVSRPQPSGDSLSSFSHSESVRPATEVGQLGAAGAGAGGVIGVVAACG